MTISEAIQKLETDGLSSVSDMEFITNALEENDKLKAETEQFSNELISVRIENELLKKKNELTNHYFEQYSASIDKIEQLKEDYSVLARKYDNVENSSIRYYNEVKQLKSELEQSIKLPCKVGDKAWCITSDQYDYITEPIECTVNEISINIDNPRLLLFRIDSNNSTDGWTDTFPDMRIPNHMNIRRIDDFGKTVFITREEAEQSLKGQVENEIQGL